jgi:hypothetical protein
VENGQIWEKEFLPRGLIPALENPQPIGKRGSKTLIPFENQGFFPKIP